MAKKYELKCNDCKFTTVFRDGPTSYGFLTTYYCNDCQKLSLEEESMDDINAIIRNKGQDSKPFLCEHCQSKNLNTVKETKCPKCDSENVKCEVLSRLC